MPLHAQDSDRLDAALRMAAARTEIAQGSLARVLRFAGIDMGGPSCWSWLSVFCLVSCLGFNVMGFLTFQYGRGLELSAAAAQVISYDFIWLACFVMYFVYRSVLQKLARRELAAILFRYRQQYSDEEAGDGGFGPGQQQLVHSLTAATNVDRDGFVERPADRVTAVDACCCSRGRKAGASRARGPRRGSVSPATAAPGSFDDQQADALLDSLSLRALAGYPRELADLRRALSQLQARDRPVGPLRTMRLRFAQALAVMAAVLALFLGMEVVTVASTPATFDEAAAILGTPAPLMRGLVLFFFATTVMGPVAALAGAVAFLAILSAEPYRIRATLLAMARVSAVERGPGGGAGGGPGLRRLPSGASVQAFLDEEPMPAVPSGGEGSGTMRARVLGEGGPAGRAAGQSRGDDDGVSLATSGRDQAGDRRRARFETGGGPGGEARRASVAGGGPGRGGAASPTGRVPGSAPVARVASAPSMPLRLPTEAYAAVGGSVARGADSAEDDDLASLLRAANAGRLAPQDVAAASGGRSPAAGRPGGRGGAHNDGRGGGGGTWQDIHAAAVPEDEAEAAPSLRPWIRLFDAQLARVRAQRRTAERVSEEMGTASAAVTALMLISGLLFIVLSQSGAETISGSVALAYGAAFFILSQIPLIKFAVLTAALRRPLLTVTSAPAGVLAQCAAVRAPELSVLLTARDHADAVQMLGSPIDPGSAIRIASLQVSFVLLALQQATSLATVLGPIA